jgi:hypothetical protein
MQDLKGNGIDWREKILISKLYMDQSVKIKLDQAQMSEVRKRS